MKEHVVHPRITALVLALFLCLSVAAAQAADVPPDLQHPGAIHLTLCYEGEPIAGGTVSARRVAEIVLRGSVYQYALTEAFAPSHIDLGDLSGTGLVQQLTSYAEYAAIPGLTVPVSNDGSADFEALPLGVYLITQEETAQDFMPLSPFLVTVPYEADGAWVYSVEALPKTFPDLHKIGDASDQDDRPGVPPGEEQTPDSGEMPGGESMPGGGQTAPGGENGDSSSSKLPQTGQLNWPIPVLVISGLVLFLTGWALRYRKGGDGDAS